MRIKVRIGDIIEAVNQVSATIDRHSGSNATMYTQAIKKSDDQQFLYLYSTNLTSETLTKVAATVEEEGKILLNSDQLLGGLLGRPKDEEVIMSSEPDGKKVKVVFGKAKFHIAADPKVDATEAQLKKLPFTGTPLFSVNGKEMAEFIRRGQFCIPTDNTGKGSILSCLYMTDSTDGYNGQATDNCIAVKMAVKSARQTDKTLGQIKLPQSALAPLARLLAKRQGEVVNLLKNGDNKLVFKFGDTMYGTLLVAGQYPNLDVVIEGRKATYTFNVNRTIFKTALDRINAFRNAKGYVEIELKNHELTLKTKNEVGTGDMCDVLQVETETGPEEGVKMAIGIDYLANIASVSRAESLTIGVSGPLQPMLISDPDEEVATRYVVMGVKGDS